MKRGPVYLLIAKHFLFYPTPVSLNFFWNFGFVSGICLVIQIVSGILLAGHYCSDASLAFNSVEYIMREVNKGWLLRYTHANGASFFLFAVYIHMARGLYYKSFLGKKDKVWYSGILIFLLIMATAFLGYVLPWGQMSFWGATVITNLISSIPHIGKTITYWLWGGFAVGGATLSRFFALHFVLPFVILGLVLLHIGLLHNVGSSSSIPFNLEVSEVIPFYPYFILKDLFVLLCFLTVFSYFVFFAPNALGHADNYIRANPLSTPTHIVPEWYFLPFYAILRSIPNKFGGFLFMGGSLFILFFLPLLMGTITIINTEITSEDAPFYDLLFWFWVISFVLLGWIGGKPIAQPYRFAAIHIASYYYAFFLAYISTGPVARVLKY